MNPESAFPGPESPDYIDTITVATPSGVTIIRSRSQGVMPGERLVRAKRTPTRLGLAVWVRDF